MKIEYLIEGAFPTYSKQSKERTDADNLKAGKDLAKKTIMKVFLSDLQMEILKLIAKPICKYVRRQDDGMEREVGSLAYNNNDYWFDDELDKNKDKIAEELKKAGFELICENNKLILMIPLVTYCQTIYIAGAAGKIMRLRYEIITTCQPLLDEIKDKLDYYGISGFDIKLYFKFAKYIEDGKEYDAKAVSLTYMNRKDMKIEGNLEYINRYATAWEIFTQLLVHPYSKISVPYVMLLGSFTDTKDGSELVPLTEYIEFDSLKMELGRKSHTTTLRPLIDAMGPNKIIRINIDNEWSYSQHTLTDELALELTGMTHKELVDREIKAKRASYDKHKVSIIQFNTSITPDDLSSLEVYCF